MSHEIRRLDQTLSQEGSRTQYKSHKPRLLADHVAVGFELRELRIETQKIGSKVQEFSAGPAWPFLRQPAGGDLQEWD